LWEKLWKESRAPLLHLFGFLRILRAENLLVCAYVNFQTCTLFYVFLMYGYSLLRSILN
jgi:hypothetical protein